MQVLKCSFKLPSNNDFIAKNRGTKGTIIGNNFKRLWQNKIYQLIKTQKLRRVKSPQWMIWEFHEKTKRRDKDNVFSFAIKVTQDALQQAQILPNDNNDWIVGHTIKFVYDKTDGFVLTMVDYDEEVDSD